jgi:hypothetical protein
MTHQSKAARLPFLFSLCILVFSTSAFAANNEGKKDLYNKGIEAVNRGDAITARDAFCEVARRDNEYHDAQQQCMDYSSIAEKALMRYKINYAQGMTFLAEARYDEAEAKFRTVRAGEYAESAQRKLQEARSLKASQSTSQQEDFDRLMHLGDSGANFLASCDGNEQFEERNRNAQPSAQSAQQNTRSMFCGGWIRGATQALRTQTIAATGHDVCMPSSVSVGQQTRLLLQYIKNHPDDKDVNASDLLSKALKGAYPCRILKNDPELAMSESE